MPLVELNAQVAVMLDTKGPEIRTGYLVDGKNITIEKDSIGEITTDYTVIAFYPLQLSD